MRYSIARLLYLFLLVAVGLAIFRRPILLFIESTEWSNAAFFGCFDHIFWLAGLDELPWHETLGGRPSLFDITNKHVLSASLGVILAFVFWSSLLAIFTVVVVEIVTQVKNILTRYLLLLCMALLPFVLFHRLFFLMSTTLHWNTQAFIASYEPIFWLFGTSISDYEIQLPADEFSHATGILSIIALCGIVFASILNLTIYIFDKTAVSKKEPLDRRI